MSNQLARRQNTSDGMWFEPGPSKAAASPSSACTSLIAVLTGWMLPPCPLTKKNLSKARAVETDNLMIKFQYVQGHDALTITGVKWIKPPPRRKN